MTVYLDILLLHCNLPQRGSKVQNWQNFYGYCCVLAVSGLCTQEFNLSGPVKNVHFGQSYMTEGRTCGHRNILFVYSTLLGGQEK